MWALFYSCFGTLYLLTSPYISPLSGKVSVNETVIMLTPSSCIFTWNVPLLEFPVILLVYLHVPRALLRIPETLRHVQSGVPPAAVLTCSASCRGGCPHVQEGAEAGRQTDVGQSREDSRVDRSGQDRTEDSQDSDTRGQRTVGKVIPEDSGQ